MNKTRKELVKEAIEFCSLGNRIDSYGGLPTNTQTVRDEISDLYGSLTRCLNQDAKEMNRIRRKYGLNEVWPEELPVYFWFWKGRKTFEVHYPLKQRNARLDGFLNFNSFDYETGAIKEAIKKLETEIDDTTVELGKMLERLDELKNENENRSKGITGESA